MRRLVRLLDALLRRAYGVFEYSDDSQCILRLRIARTPRVLELGGERIEAGAPAVELHLWNEHLPALPPGGPDLAWASRLGRLWVDSLRSAARYMASEPGLAGVRAVGGVTSLLSTGEHRGGARMLERLGFTVMPHRGPLGRFGEFWENFYGWWLIWAYNAGSLRRRRLHRLERIEMWMPAGEFIERFGK